MMRYFEEDGQEGNENNDFEGNGAVGGRQRLVEGINLRDLVDGKDVIFHISEDYSDINCASDDVEPPDGVDNNAESLEKIKGKKGPPDPTIPFRTLGASMENVIENGLVKKQIIVEGSGPVASKYSRMTVHYNFYKENSFAPFDSTYLRKKPAKLCTNQGTVIEGLDIALCSMKKGEYSRFLICWEVAFGKQGCPPRIGKECDIIADILLVNFVELGEDLAEPVTEEEMQHYNFNQTIIDARNNQCIGNEEYNSGRIKYAIRSYKKALKLLNTVKIANESEEAKMHDVKVKCLVNLAICYNKTNKYEKACMSCRDALAIHENNVKALFQYGRANLCLSNLVAAEKWLKKAHALKKEDEDIIKELDKLQEKKKLCEMEDEMHRGRRFNTGSDDSDSSEVGNDFDDDDDDDDDDE